MNYRKLFVITREMQKKRMPDDLMQLTFEFIGDLDETLEELKNKHVFSRIQNLISGKTYAHYCHCCDRILMFKTSKGLMRHVESNGHEWMNEYEYKRATRDEIKQTFKIETCWSSFYRRLNPNIFQVVDIEYKKPV